MLWQQGAEICVQPHSFKHHILLINGDIFTKRDDHSMSDTEWLIRRINECNDNEIELLEIFRSLEGPYSIVYMNQNTKQLYFLRDVLGRQSLLLARNNDGDIILSSVLAASKRNFSRCVELLPHGIFCMNLETENIYLHPWQSLNDEKLDQMRDLHEIFDKHIEIKSIVESPWLVKDLTDDSSHSYNFEDILKDYIKNSSEEIFNRLLDKCEISSVCDEIIMRLENSLSDRISATPSLCRECLKLNCNECDHARIGILFSGGIDCSILAVLTDKILDSKQPIDLINVSFEKVNRSTSKVPIDYNTPDRISAKDSLEELKRINPKR